MTAPKGRPPASSRSRGPKVDPSRRVALDVLRAVGERDAYANLVLPNSLRSSGLTGRDAAFATELTYGTLRGQGTYDAIISECVDRPLDQVDRGVRDVLRLGAHQLFGMQVPVHAAVNASVELTKTSVGPGPVGFVNAVMRRMASRPLDDWISQILRTGSAEEVADDPARSLGLRYAHPPWIVRAFHSALGTWDETEAALRADNQAPVVSLIARPGRATVDELVAAGAVRGQWSPWAATWPAGDPGTIAAVREGRAGVQDEGSQLVAQAVANRPLAGADRRWLDLCAGPGGKTALLAGLARERGASVTAVELRAHRAELVRSATGGDVDVVTGDATDARWATADYDRVLVDAPCSGLGALRRRPEARWRRSVADVDKLRSLQERLLAAALDAVRAGGVVGYITCSPIAQETREVVDAVVARLPGVHRLDARDQFSHLPMLGDGPDVQLWPHRHGTDAMYLALLTRSHSPGEGPRLPACGNPDSAEHSVR